MEKELSLDQRRKIQKSLLYKLHNFCVDNNIKYSLAYGTFLGAVRHQGYIPWDDDIDIYMLREDYNKFEELFPTIYDESISLASTKRVVNWHVPFSKLYDINTILIENRTNTRPIGVNIDIFILDDVPDDNKVWSKQFKKQRLFLFLNAIKTLKWSKERKVYTNIAISAMKFILLLVSNASIVKAWEKLAMSGNNKGYKRVFETTEGTSSPEPFRKDLFSEMQLYEFEEYKFFGFKNFDEYLTRTYGDYMQLPPIDKQVTHHHSTAYLK